MSQMTELMMAEGVMVDADELSRMQMLSELLKYSLIVISALPLILVYPFVQKQFIKGVMIGAIKG